MEDRLIKVRSNDIMMREEVKGETVYRKKTTFTYAIHLGFFDKYFQGDNSLVFIGGCEALDGDIQSVLIAKGTDAVVGYQKEKERRLVEHTPVGYVWGYREKIFRANAGRRYNL